jgi:diamine N-acetyltransferase
MLKGKKVILRAVELSDKSIIYRWENDTDQWPISFTTKPFSSETIEQYISSDAYDIYTTKQLRLMVCLPDNTPLGCVDLFDFDPRNQRAGVGVLIDKYRRKMGYALDALEVLKTYAFGTLFLHQIYAHIDDYNEKSIALFQKSGFQQIGVLNAWNKKSNQVFNDVIIMQCKNS